MKSPFKFLDSYTKDDREIFFGREREIEELYHRVFESKIMLVYGVSGTGKSSLINCGLANKFSETDWLPLNIRRGGNILDSLAASIKAASITQQTAEIISPSRFKKAVRSLYLDHYKPVFFIFDQFEELFIFGNKDEKKAFIQVIKTLVESELQCRFIFIMREEYMASVTEFERYIPYFFANRVRIEKMSHLNAVEAIKGPCKIANIDIEEGFAEALLEKLSPESAEVELTYLQVFLDKIFRLASTISPPPSDTKALAKVSGGESKGGSLDGELQEGAFTIPLLSLVGNVSDLLGSFLEEQISLLNDAETGLLVLKSFVSVKGTKQPMKINEVADYVVTFGKKPDEAVLSEFILNFVSLRILCDKDQNERYELRHDALAAKIYEKFTLAEKELLDVRKFVENAFFTFESRGIFMNKQDLEYLSGFEKNLILPHYLNDFINQSRNKLLSQKRSLVRITRISVLLLLLLLAPIVRYLLSTRESNKTDRMIATALIQSQTNPVEGIFSALELWVQDSSSQVLQYIVLNNFKKLLSINSDSSGSLARLQMNFAPLKLESPVIQASMSKNDEFIYGWMENNRIFILDHASGKVFYINSDKKPAHIELSSKDSSIAVVYKDNTGGVFDFRGRTIYNIKPTLNEVMNERLVRYFPSGNFHLAVVEENRALIYDKTGRIVYDLRRHSDRINALDISPDGQFIATASSDKKVYIWDINKSGEISVYDSLIGHYEKIWSCEFSSSGKYLLTASADSTIKIWTLNGKEINPPFFFSNRFYTSLRSKSNNRETDPDAANPLFKFYYRRFCNATFSKGKGEIIATGYNTGRDSSGKSIVEYNQVLFFDPGSLFYKVPPAAFLQFTNPAKVSIDTEQIDQLLVSPGFSFAIGSNKQYGEIKIVAPGGVRFLTLEGIYPMVSNNGDVLFWVYKNEIRRILLNPRAIQDLLGKYGVNKSSLSRDKILVII